MGVVLALLCAMAAVLSVIFDPVDLVIEILRKLPAVVVWSVAKVMRALRSERTAP
jgi:hypothetical protein